ncbi:MAG: ribonuclease P protein component, partial [Opitutaceae bacterium]
RRRQPASISVHEETAPKPPDQARVCVIASTAAVGAAVARNRAKRRLREIFRHHQTQVPVDCDLLLIARAALLNWPYVELEKKFSEACGHISSQSQSQSERK